MGRFPGHGAAWLLAAVTVLALVIAAPFAVANHEEGHDGCQPVIWHGGPIDTTLPPNPNRPFGIITLDPLDCLNCTVDCFDDLIDCTGAVDKITCVAYWACTQVFPPNQCPGE